VKEDPEKSETQDWDAEEASRGEEREALPAEELAPAEEGAELEEPELEVLQREIGLLESQLQDMRDRYIRAVADLDNMRKRSRRDMKEAQQRAVSSLLLDLLVVVDNFERALGPARASARGEGKAVYDGVALIYRQLMDMLGRRGVKPIAAVGERFDPARHEAVAQVPAEPNQEEGTIALEVQKGYFHGEEVLRPSKVGVTVHGAHKG